MKKKLLPLAMLAGLAGAAGTAQAAFVSPQGSGESLIYPFYTVEGGQDTYINVVNTTAYTKAVKVRFLEAMNSAEVLDFNLYLSPYDHWSGVVTTTEDGEGAMVKTADTSCTVPGISSDGEPFRQFEYTGVTGEEAEGDGGPQTLSRTREGYVEIIEMGVIEDDLTDGTDALDSVFGAEADILHGSNGSPADCDALVAAFLEDGTLGEGYAEGVTGTGNWYDENAGSDSASAIYNNFVQIGNTAPALDGSDTTTVVDAAYMDAIAGGLYGYGTIINVPEGTAATYSATALDDVYSGTGSELDLKFPNHQQPGSTLPNLGQAHANAVILNGSTATDWTSSASNELAGWEAVSAALMHAEIINDYVMEPTLAAGTDWVVTMPTKRAFVYNTPDDEPIAPFLNIWETSDEGAGACEEINVDYWDREEQIPAVDPTTGDIDFSPAPPPPTVEIEGFALCSEANVITFIGPDGDVESGEGYTPVLYPSERVAYGFHPEFNNGWARFDLRMDSEDEPRVLSGSSDLLGLPTVGFAVQKYVNGTLEDGAVLSNYAGLVDHKTVIEEAEQTAP
ncbi:hypothetical protein [Gilvimarinus xylanilyticus]|uniref:Cell surface protein n=1 Tax=Gilvimarinus xylanilyticus TaxID=2944139 RepID=A0A9X2HZH0_9GAMM|nr:hypothetical protein [Gilvimarinus xylanilyticus]MCP8899371.1 hypothetical protein [Gilvimarinus xylanilyticus]